MLSFHFRLNTFVTLNTPLVFFSPLFCVIDSCFLSYIVVICLFILFLLYDILAIMYHLAFSLPCFLDFLVFNMKAPVHVVSILVFVIFFSLKSRLCWIRRLKKLPKNSISVEYS